MRSRIISGTAGNIKITSGTKLQASGTKVGGEITGGGEIRILRIWAPRSKALTIRHLKVSSQVVVTDKTGIIRMIEAGRPGGTEGASLPGGFRCRRPRGLASGRKRITITSLFCMKTDGNLSCWDLWLGLIFNLFTNHNFTNNQITIHHNL